MMHIVSVLVWLCAQQDVDRVFDRVFNRALDRACWERESVAGKWQPMDTNQLAAHNHRSKSAMYAWVPSGLTRTRIQLPSFKRSVCEITGRLGVHRIAFLGDSVTANQVQSMWSLMGATSVLVHS